MKYLSFILLITSSCIFPMEAERKSLASFFAMDTYCEIQNVIQKEAVIHNIVHQYVPAKQWWYVDQEVDLRQTIGSVGFNQRGTMIDAWSTDDDHVYLWNREYGIELGSVRSDDYYRFMDENVSDEDDSSEDIPNECYEEGRLGLSGLHRGFYGMQRDVRKKIMVAWRSSRVYVWNMVEKKEIAQLAHEKRINSVDVNNRSGGEIVTVSHDRTMRLWCGKTGKELLRIVYDACVRDATFNFQGTEIVVGTKKGRIQVLARYDKYNLQQLLLKKLLHVWLQVEKPNKNISAPEELLHSVATLLCCDRQELHNAWASFPENMRNAVWLSMYKKIQKYGK